MTDTTSPKNPILVVDDQQVILMTIDTTLHKAGLNNIISCRDSRKVMDIFCSHEIEVILLDLNMPHVNGEELLSRVHRDYPDVPIIIITGADDVETAVRCMKKGAFDYLAKPLEDDRLVTSVKRAIELRDLKRENVALKEHILSESLDQPDAFSDIITQNSKMISIFHYIESIAQTSQPILLTGETGVGKELFARAIHKLSGLSGDMVSVNVAGLDDNLFSDTLFGHGKGAFSGAITQRNGLIEKAEGGTLFLDEVGDLSLSSQIKLLRLLQEREYLPLGQDEHKKTNARIILSANKDLLTLKDQGRFREDLYFRLRTHHISIPPLRERKDDIPILVEYFLRQSARSLKKKTPTPPRELFTLLETYSFPGNVRELQAMTYDAVSRHKSRILSLEVFKEHITSGHYDTNDNHHAEAGGNASVRFGDELPTIRETIQLLVLEAMERAKGVQSIAARMLGISHQALSKRLKKMKDQGLL